MRRLAAAALIALALAPNALAAASGPVFGLRAVGNPKLGYFVYPLAPGGTATGAVIVSNVGTKSGVVHLFTADGTTGTTSGTVYRTDAKPTGAGSWVKLAATSFVLPAGGHRQVSFTVHVPAGQKPGQWVGGVVAETARQVATQKPGQKARVQIRIRDLTIVAVQANVPGRQTVDFGIGKVTTGGTRGFQKVIVHFEHRGNVLVHPHGVVTLFRSSGPKIETLPFAMDTFLPQTSIDYPILLKKAIGPGSYTAKVVLDTPPVGHVPEHRFVAQPSFSISKTDVKQVFTSAPPQQAPPGTGSSSGLSTVAYVGIGAGVVVLAVLLLALLLARRRRGGATSRPPTTLQRPPAAAVADPPAADAPVRPHPTPPAPPAPPPVEPAPPAPLAPLAAPTPAAPAAPTEDHEHEWDVAYDRGELGSDGVWRFPHRCRHCGATLLATDVQDARARTAAR
jgi:hypothetical protein